MREDYREWLNARPNILGNISIAREDLIKLFEIYNSLSPNKMKPTTCGSCLTNVKKTIKLNYEN